MFTEPVDGSTTGLLEMPDISIEVTPGEHHESLGLQCLFIGGEGEIGDGDGVVQGDDHQQRCGGDSRYPHAGLVHSSRAGRTQGDRVLPNARGKWLEIKVYGDLRAVRRPHVRIVTDDGLSHGRLPAGLATFVVRKGVFHRVDQFGRNPSKSLFVAADRGYLCDHAAKTTIRRAQYDRV